MPALLVSFRARASVVAALAACAVAFGQAGCQSNAPNDKDSAKGGSGAAPTAGSSGAGSPSTGGSAPTGGTGAGGSAPTGGTSAGASAPTGGTSAGGSAPTGGTGAGGSAQGGAAGSASGSGGASTGGSGTGGSAGANAGAGGGSGDPCATALFCDDFEGAAANGPPATPWAVQRGGTGTAAVDTMHHMSGVQSVQFVVPGQNDSAYIALRNAPVFPVTGNAFYGRVMVWLMAAPTASVHWTIIEGSGLVPGQSYHSAYRLGGQQPIMNGGTFVGSQLMANYETPDSYGGNGPGSDCWHHTNRVVIPVGRWSCFEWKYDGPNNALTQWVDGTEVLSVTGMGNPSNGDGCVNQPASFAWTAPTFDTIRVGWDSYQADSSRTLWLDDFAMATARVGCPSGTGQ